MIFLDHIGLMKTRARPKRSEELAGLTRALKEFAMRRSVAVVELVQAARESEGRRMGLRDMFGSATIEQDADGVLALEPQGEGAVSGRGRRDVRVSVLKWREGGPAGKCARARPARGMRARARRAKRPAGGRGPQGSAP